MESSYGTLFTLKVFYVLHEMSVCMELSKFTLYSPDFQLYLQINSNQISVYFCRCTCACACSSSYLARVYTLPRPVLSSSRRLFFHRYCGQTLNLKISFNGSMCLRKVTRCGRVLATGTFILKV